MGANGWDVPVQHTVFHPITESVSMECTTLCSGSPMETTMATSIFQSVCME